MPLARRRCDRAPSSREGEVAQRRALQLPGTRCPVAPTQASAEAQSPSEKHRPEARAHLWGRGPLQTSPSPQYGVQGSLKAAGLVTCRGISTGGATALQPIAATTTHEK
jgi:hypothetical protein